MASTADKVLRNIVWRLESLSLTDSRPGRGLVWLDPEIMSPEDSPQTRSFIVQWLSQEPFEADTSVTDLVERIATHDFAVEVNYPHEYKLLERQELMLRDRHDIIKMLRDPRLFAGFSAADSSEDIGLYARQVARVESADEYEDTTTLRFELACTILEAE